MDKEKVQKKIEDVKNKAKTLPKTIQDKAKNKIQDADENKKLKKISIAFAGVSIIAFAGFALNKTIEQQNKNPDVLIDSLYNYAKNGSYALQIDSLTDTNCMLNSIGLPLDSSLAVNGTISSNGQNKYIKLTLDGSPTYSFGTDDYSNTSVQIYTDENNAYYGLGDEFSWKKASKENIAKANEEAAQECLISIKDVSEKEFEEAFSDVKVNCKDGKNILTGKIDLAKFRDSEHKDQLYVLYGLNDVKELKADISVSFVGKTPTKGSLNLAVENTTSLDDMYEKMELAENEQEMTVEKTAAYDDMNVEKYVSDDTSLGDMTVKITSKTAFSFVKATDKIEMPDMSSEDNLNDISDVLPDLYGLNNTINYLFGGV